MKPGGISCKEVVELITAYLDGALAPEQAERVRGHLELCDPCIRYVEQIRVTGQLAAEATRELELHPDRDALLATFRNFTRTTDP